MTGNAADSQAQPPAQAAAETGDQADVAALDQRVGAIETEQREQRGILDKVLAAVTGGAPAAAGPAAGAAAGAAPPDAASIAAQVRREIAEADQRRQVQDEDKRWRDDVTQVVERVKQESAPREPETGFRGRLQRLVIGKQD